MIDVRIGFKNGTTLQFQANKFEVEKSINGRKTYRWNVAGLNTQLEDLNCDEVLYVITRGNHPEEGGQDVSR